MKRWTVLSLIYFLLFSNSVLAKTERGNSMDLKKKDKSSMAKTVYSFRPLLIQGKKRFSDKSKDLKIEGESIVESEILSIRINLKDRIFELESM